MSEQTPAVPDSAWPNTERRKDEITRNIRDIQDKLKTGEARMDAQDIAIAENTEVTKQIKSDTAEIVDFAQSVKGALKVFDMIGKLAKPLTYIIMLGTAVYGVVSAWKTGQKYP